VLASVEGVGSGTGIPRCGTCILTLLAVRFPPEARADLMGTGGLAATGFMTPSGMGEGRAGVRGTQLLLLLDRGAREPVFQESAMEGVPRKDDELRVLKPSSDG